MGSPNRTPESLMARADSKNPTSTCKGITSSGRPCRRGLASPKPSAPRNGPPGADDFCYQHKDQASDFQGVDTPIKPLKNSRINSLQRRSSVDSLAARLGVTTISDSRPAGPRPGSSGGAAGAEKHHRHHPLVPQRPQSSHGEKGSHHGFWSSLCCLANDLGEDYIEVVRHKRKGSQGRPDMSEVSPTSQKPSSPPYLASPTSPTHPGLGRRQDDYRYDSAASVPLQKPQLPSDMRRTASTPDTRDLLTYIPPHLSPQKTSALLIELSKPISPNDEAGYIYIFWLTDSKSSAPSQDAARSLLSPPTPTRGQQQHRRPSDVMSAFASSGASSSRGVPSTSKKPPTIMLKIGRANNVHRRMNEWTRQCGYDLSLVRWYPYVPSSSSSPSSPNRSSPDKTRLSPERSHSGQVHKVPHAHRVERLVHLELADQRVKRDCVACGKEHREWFEVEATEGGVRAVDEVIKRWVRWAEGAEGVLQA